MYAMALNANVPNPYLEKNDEEPAGVTNEAKTEDDGMKIDLNGLANRIMVLPFPAGNYGGFTGTKNGFFAVADGVLTQYTMGSKAGTPIYEGVGSYEMTPDRQKMLVMGRGGPQIVPVAPGGNPNTGRLDLSGVEAVIDPKAEWKQMFWDAWRYERDYFYDDSMGKQDWLALGKRYEKYLGDVNSRFDLNYLLGMLIGELGTGHSYIQGQGDLGIIMPRNPVGNLCADYVVENGKVKFAKILRGSNDSEQYQTPLGLPGIDVKEGEFLLEIDGNEVNASTHPATLLQGKIGKTVSLLVGPSASGSGARKVRVKPISSDLNARYWEFIDGNRKKVLELSGGRIGYFHVRDTAAQGSEDVVRGFYSQWHKDAILVDERWNGGGYIQPWFVDTLSRTRKAMIQPRYGGDQPESPSNQGPMALLINQYAGSGGDFFPYMFRQAKRGPLIGKRTWGGLVGISGGYNLVDGGNLTAPGFSIYDPEKNEIIAENMGIDPDIDVDMRPDLVAQGKDPQLEAGVKYLLEQLAKMPPKKERVGTPKVGSNGKINP
jgi:tricorn protease